MNLRRMYLPLIGYRLRLDFSDDAGPWRRRGPGARSSKARKKKGDWFYIPGWRPKKSSLFTKEFTKKYPFIKPEVFRSSGEKVQARFHRRASRQHPQRPIFFKPASCKFIS